jgi:PKD repeat protein
MKYKILLFAIILNLCANSQVVINEYSCANRTNHTDNYGEYEDWFELYNAGATPAVLDGFFLSDRATNPMKWQIPTLTIPAGGRKIIYASKRDEVVGGNYHTNFKLTQTNPEVIVLTNPSGVTIDLVNIVATQKNHSYGRKTDGDAVWGVFTTTTPNAANTSTSYSYAPTPVFSMAAGNYLGTINVNISVTGTGFSIRYTTNGSEPTAASTLVAGPVSVSATTVIRARTFSTDPLVLPSLIETNTYFINESHVVKVVSVCGDQVDELLNGNSGIEPEGAFELFSENMVLLDEATGEYNKHGNDSWAYDQRGFDYVTRDEFGSNYAIRNQIFRNSTRDEFQRLMLKPAANDNYPFADGAHIRDAYVQSLSQIGELKMDERSHEPCVLYMNGQYWGVYEIREKVDDNDFTDYYYDQDVPDIQFLKTWGGTWSEYGGAQAQTDWNTIRDYILTNDMSVQANYEYAISVYNHESLVDYVVLNSYIVCSDWLNWNTAWWRGLNPDGDKKKWRYVLWDMDASFGHYINYTGIPDQSAGADPCDPEDLSDPGGQGHIPVLNALMDNAEFRQYYVSRYIDLSNNVFNCEFMINHLDSLIDLIEPEMNRQITKWGGTYTGWQNNVQVMRDFINQRCADLSGGMIDCYDVTGPYELTFQVMPAGSGEIKVNSLWLDSYPFTGTYYGNIDILLKASAQPGFMFDYWELVSHTVSPDADSANAVLQITGGDYIIAHFVSEFDLDIGNDTTICDGSYIVLDAGEGDSYLWNDGSTSQLYWVTEPGNYSVTVTYNGNSYSDNIIVTINSAFAGQDQTICSGNSAQLSGSNAVAWNWSPAESLNNPNIQNPIASPTDTTTYTLVVIDVSGCHYTDFVTVNVLPPVNIEVTANTSMICPGDEVLLTFSLYGGGGPPYTLYNDEGILVSPVSLHPEETTNYIFYATDDCNSFNSTEITIETFPPPDVNISADKLSGCQPLIVTFNNMEDGAGNNYWWSFGDVVNNFSDKVSPVHTYLDPGMYDVSLRVINEYGCDSLLTLEELITVYPKPIANFEPKPGVVSKMKPYVFFENSSIGYINTLWDFGDGGNSDEISPVYGYLDTGIYEVQLIVISDKLCADTAISYVIVNEDYTFWAPTAIRIGSPGKNARFFILANGIVEEGFYMAIYDRWGQRVYETNQYDVNLPDIYGWDGRIKEGKLAPTGVYTYMVSYRTFENIEYQQGGFFTLMR